MKIKYFQDTDTLYIEFRATEAAETKDLDENSALDLIIGGGGQSSAIFFGDGRGGFILQVPDPPVTAVDRVADIVRVSTCRSHVPADLVTPV